MIGCRARALVGALCLVTLVACGGGDDDDARSTTTSSDSGDESTTSTETPTSDGGDTGVTDGSAPAGETDAPLVDTEPLPPVAVGEPADFGGGLLATVTEVESVDLAAQAPGETAGPGILVTVELRNDTDAAVDLAGVAINATYGDGTPAIPHRTGPITAFSGTLDPGETTSATYGFRVPDDGMDSVVIDVHHSGYASFVVVEVGAAVG